MMAYTYEARRFHCKGKPDTPRIWLRVDKAHVARVLKARRAMCFGEEVRVS
jgi:hypothetical protein